VNDDCCLRQLDKRKRRSSFENFRSSFENRSIENLPSFETPLCRRLGPFKRRLSSFETPPSSFERTDQHAIDLSDMAAAWCTGVPVW
jgi:hypothetical protein